MSKFLNYKKANRNFFKKSRKIGLPIVEIHTELTYRLRVATCCCERVCVRQLPASQQLGPPAAAGVGGGQLGLQLRQEDHQGGHGSQDPVHRSENRRYSTGS